MLFDARSYSVLVVSASDKFNASLRSLLADAYEYTFSFVSSIAAAKRKTAEREYDMILINAPLPDDTGVRFALDTVAASGTVCLLMVRAEQYDEMREKVLDGGVFTLQKPFSASVFSQCMGWLCAARERLRHMEKKSATFEEKMEEIRLVNRAKWRLIEQKGLTEPQAHRMIEKLAMDRCVTRRQIAQEILNGEDAASLSET